VIALQVQLTAPVIVLALQDPLEDAKTPLLIIDMGHLSLNTDLKDLEEDAKRKGERSLEQI